MTSPAKAAPAGSQQAAPQPRPFLQGSWEYSEVVFTDVAAVTANAQNFSHNITPGGYLRGITLSVTAAGGVLGAGVITADAPFNVLSSISLESIDGTPILYPMGGYAYYLVELICRPWDDDPKLDPAFSATINPAFRLRIFNESRATIGVTPNTDARAQYRLLYTIAPSTNWLSTAPTTLPTLTINGYLETYAQPPREDLQGRPFQTQPAGLALQRFVSHSIFASAGGNQLFKADRVGNLVRANILVFRDNSGSQGGVGTRIDLTGDPIRQRLDNTAILTENRDRRDYLFDQFYGSGAANLRTRPTGVYPYWRFHDPGNVQGQSWMETTEGSFLQWEVNGAPAGGTCELITEDLVPVGPIPHWMMGL